VVAVVHDTIVLNIPAALLQWIAQIEVQIERQQTILMTFTTQLGQKQTITIPQESISAMEEGSTYNVKVSDHVLRAPNGPS
jgi:hypothetical protein